MMSVQWSIRPDSRVLMISRFLSARSFHPTQRRMNKIIGQQSSTRCEMNSASNSSRKKDRSNI